MADPFIVVIGAMSLVSLVLILRNTLSERVPRPRIYYEGDGLTVNIEDSRLQGIAFVSEELPPHDRDPGRRVLRLARDAGVSVSIVSGLYRVQKDRILRRIEEVLGRLEAAYSISRSARIKSMLETVTSIYNEVAITSQPYWGALAVVVWVPPGPEGLARAEAFKTLLEAELGVNLERIREPSCQDILAPQPSARPISDNTIVLPPRQYDVRGYPVVVGWRLDLESAVYALDYPSDFSTHIAVVGPTGKGKTVLLAGIASQLAALSESTGDPSLLLVIDPKGDLKALLGGGGGQLKIVGPEVGVEAALEELSGLWARRESTFGRVVVIVDEAWRFMRGSPEVFEAIAREGRSLGFHIVYAVQEPSDIPKPIADNTGTFIVFGGKTFSYAELASRLGLEGMTSELLELPVGEAIIAKRDSKPVPVRVMNFTKLLKTSEPSRATQWTLGEGRIGEEAKTTADGEGLTHLQEPRPHTPGTSKVSAPDERGP
ncbi:MAG: DUF87 domain-containing protein [Desulfurococcales archaeon]|nr:DUF87 domain-containing protein [Desulfurococcales archaeon]